MDASTQKALIIAILTLHNIIPIVIGNAEIDCISVKSQYHAAAYDGTITDASCPNTHPTLVSCGYETLKSSETKFEGGWIDRSSSTAKCNARNANGGDGVWAHARCCNFQQSVSCASYDGTEANNDDQESTVSCNPAVPYMLGCTGRQIYTGFDGVYPGNPDTDHPQTKTGVGAFNNPTLFNMINTCNAQNGQDRLTRANINCCSASVGLDCKLVYRAPTGANRLGNLYCPSGYTMMGCMASNDRERAKYAAVYIHIVRQTSMHLTQYAVHGTSQTVVPVL